MSEELFVCGIGASAGGLAPLEEFFDSVPTDAGLAYVVIQHLSPDHESMMATLLGRHTDMTIAQAVDGSLLERNHIYLIPPSTEMTVFGGRLRLRARSFEGGSLPRPISVFFNSLAAEFGERAIAVVLSGSGSDGADGIESVRRVGGLTLAQDQTAAFQGMPDSARATGMIDASINPGEMPEIIVGFANGKRPAETIVTLEAPELRILRAISESSDVDFNQYKSSTVHRRIGRRSTLTRCAGLDEYADLIERNSVERDLLVEDLLLDVSAFFRDPPAWRVVESQITQLLTEAAERATALRIWSAATSTGEEAYSLAMAAVEARERAGLNVPIQVFATDVHRGSLATAAAGRYEEDRLIGVSAARRDRFFERVDDAWHVRRELRSLVTFANHNLLADAPFTRIDMVVCRNMLIYLRSAAQETALSLLFTGLRNGGVLVLGPSETPGVLDQDLSTIDRTWRVFRKEGDTTVRRARRLPVVPGALSGGRFTRSARSTVTADQRLLRAYDAILDSQFVAGMLVDQAGELVHTFGQGTRLMGPPRGRPTLDVVSLIEDPVIRIAVSAVLSRLASDGSPDDVTRAVVLPEGFQLSSDTGATT
ncbi:MAG: chemotaxis protein CheB, partial [Actinomycetota bacterium]